MQSAFIQSDVAFWGYTGTGIYEGRPKVDTLRAIANLYPESFQLVARKGSGIKTIMDLKGKRVTSNFGGHSVIPMSIAGALATGRPAQDSDA